MNEGFGVLLEYCEGVVDVIGCLVVVLLDEG